MKFESSWSRDSLDHFVEAARENEDDNFEESDFFAVMLVELVRVDLHRSWSSGFGRTVEEYVKKFPALISTQDAHADLLLAEYNARRAVGDGVEVSSYRSRFPSQFPQLEQKLRDRPEPHSSSGSAAQASIDTSRLDDLRDTKNVPASERTGRLPQEFGRYQIIRELGSGAMGTVYLAKDMQLDRKVALKTPSFVGHEHDELIARFYREARAAAKLQHRNICPVYDVGEIDGRHFISMAYIRGRSLSLYIQPEKLPPARSTTVLVQRLSIAMAEAHRQNVIHRDLKPANIMIDVERQPIVMDFGLARQLDSESQFTRSGLAVGTPAYMSPEQIRGELEEVGRHADIYALGVILYELLTGRLPFRGPIAKVVYSIVHEQPIPPSEVRQGVDIQLESICAKMMAKERNERYQSMEEVASVLATYLKHGHISSDAKTSQGSTPDTQSSPSRMQPGETAALNAFFATQKSRDSVEPPVDETHASNPQPSLAIRVQADPARPVRSRALIGKGRSSRQMLIAFGAVLVGAAVFGATFFLRTGNALLRVELNDPSIRVSIQGTTLTFEDSGREITLRPSSDNALKISVAGSTFVTPGAFELVKGENPVARVSFVKDELVAKLGEIELERWHLAREVRMSKTETGTTSEISEVQLTPFEILTSPDYEWSEPIHIGHPDTADNLDTALTDDIVTWYSDTKGLPTKNPTAKKYPDLWKLTRGPGAKRWNPPVRLGDGINTEEHYESSLTVTPDGLECIFTSVRPGGLGLPDLWRSKRESTDQPWSDAVNMGRRFNFSGWDWSPTLSADGLELFYTSCRDGGPGDIWCSRRGDLGEDWPPPRPIRNLDGSSKDHAATLSSDGRVLFFMSFGRPGNIGITDIWMSTRRAPGYPWSKPIRLPEPVNSTGREAPRMISADGSLLVFRRGLDDGVFWSSRRVPVSD